MFVCSQRRHFDTRQIPPLCGMLQQVRRSLRRIALFVMAAAAKGNPTGMKGRKTAPYLLRLSMAMVTPGTMRMASCTALSARVEVSLKTLAIQASRAVCRRLVTDSATKR